MKEEEGAPEINQESREGVRALECIQGERKGEKIKKEGKGGKIFSLLQGNWVEVRKKGTQV